MIRQGVVLPAKNKLLFLIAVFALLPVACRVPAIRQPLNPPPAPETASPAAADIPIAASIEPIPPTATQVIIPTETVSAPTPSPTVTRTPKAIPSLNPVFQLSEKLRVVVEGGDWQKIRFDPELGERWETFARTGQGLASDSELEQIRAFLEQWNAIQAAAGFAIVPANADVVYGTVTSDSETGSNQFVLYPGVGASSETFSPNPKHLFLMARDIDGMPAGLVAAPVIDGLSQRASLDGRFVEYYDPERGQTLMYADAVRLDTEGRSEQVLQERLTDLYRKNHPYVRSGLFPRYYFPVEGIDAGFYRLEESLTFSQILQMNEAFSLFLRPELEPFRKVFFSGDTSVIIEDELGIALGLTYRGTGVMELDRRELFGNRYDLAEVLAHEGAHVLQGWSDGEDPCTAAFRMEVGDRTIPNDFFEWPAQKVINYVRSMQIGAYHVSLWMLHHLNTLGNDYNLWSELIQTGEINGQSVVPACEN